ncbi:MAG: tetratricopeptide repeat protein, partial [Aquaticitalea sp.]
MSKQNLLFVFILIPFIGFNQTLKENLVKAYSSKDSSDYYFKIAKKLIKSEGDEGEYLFCKGARQTDFGIADSAIYYSKLAIEKISRTDNINSLLTIYNNLSKVYNKRGEYDKAIEATLKGLKIAENANNDIWTAFFNISLAINYHDFENFSKGVYYGKKALKFHLSSKEPNPTSIYSSLNAIAINFDDWNQPDSALFYHRKVFDYVKGDDTLVISTYNNIGNTLHKMNKTKEAQKWLERALRISEANKDANYGLSYDYEQATQYTNLATIAFELNDFKKAERLFDSAYVRATKSKNAEKMRDYYYAQFQYNKKRKNLEKTIEFQEDYIVLRDSVFNEKRAQSITEVEAKYQNEKKE